MNRASAAIVKGLMKFGPSILPFADAATEELPMSRLLRLSLFQVTVGMAAVLLIGTLNRVMIVELAVPSWIVASMLALPLLFAPFRALVGFRSDNHRSVLGWKRVPFIWLGTMLQFGGLAIMPFALLILSGDTTGPLWIGQAAAALAFLLVGAGLHTVQTVGLALATLVFPAGACGAHLDVQGAALVTIVTNGIALWQQEPRGASSKSSDAPRPEFRDAWATFAKAGRTRRRLIATALGTAGFSMQDILLEPYGGKILHLPVGATTALTATLAVGGGVGLWIAARRLTLGADPHRVAALGALVGIVAFAAVIFAAPMGSQGMFAVGVGLFGSRLAGH